MRKVHRIIIATMLILLLIPGFGLAQSLKDLHMSKYMVEIEKLIEDGTIAGYEDGTFKPKDGITRGELAKLLALTLNLEEKKESAGHFTDVKGKWNQGFVGGLYEKGIMIGVSQDKFGQNNNVSREELAVVMLRIFDLEEVAAELALELEFEDLDEVSSWAQDAVGLVSRIGLMEGIKMDQGLERFQPKAIGQRELVAKLIFELKYNRDVYNERIREMQEISKEERLDGEIKDGDNSKEEAKSPSYEEIVAKHSGKLYELEGRSFGQLGDLYNRAVKEYEDNKDKEGFSGAKLYDKYMKIALELEANVDGQVESILAALKSELESYGYETSVVSELRSYYQEAKDAAIEGL